jgi:hypothetical protein
MKKYVIAIVLALLCVVGLYFWFAQDSVPPCDPTAETDVSALIEPAPMDPATPSDTERYSLQDAVIRELVEYKVVGTGAASGESLIISIKLTNDQPIDVFILPGTIFTPDNPNAQRMVAWGVAAAIVKPDQVSPVTSMYLSDSNVHLFFIEAYCVDIHLDNPKVTDSFLAPIAEPVSIPETLDIRAAQIMREGKKRNFSFQALQVALWKDHEGVTQKEIKTKYDASVGDTEKAWELVQTLPPPKSLGAGRQTVLCK